MPSARVHRISAAAPNDVSGIEAAIAAGRIDPAGIVAILGKTEGNGNVNDFTRGYATQSLTLLLAAQRMAEAESRNQTVATHDTLKSMALSRGAGSLGVAVALGELDASDFADPDIGANASLWSGRASASAGIELMNHEIVVLGMSSLWSGPLSIDHAVMRDAIDTEPVRGAFHRLGFTAAGQLAPSERLRLVAVLAKAEASH